MKLRCRLMLHKWARFKLPSGEWETRCRYCGKRRRMIDIPPGAPVG